MSTFYRSWHVTQIKIILNYLLKLTITCGHIKPHHRFQPILIFTSEFSKGAKFWFLNFSSKRKCLAILNSRQVFYQSFMDTLSNKVYTPTFNILPGRQQKKFMVCSGECRLVIFCFYLCFNICPLFADLYYFLF